MKILMVCLGNFCRSPLAEGILRHKAQEAGLPWLIDSAGTNNYFTGKAPHPYAQKLAAINGIDISEHRARRCTPSDFKTFDIVYAMAGDVLNDLALLLKEAFDPAKARLLLNEIDPAKNIDVPDPYYGEEDAFHEAYLLINAACEQVILKYGGDSQPGNDRIHIPLPYNTTL